MNFSHCKIEKITPLNAKYATLDSFAMGVRHICGMSLDKYLTIKTQSCQEYHRIGTPTFLLVLIVLGIRRKPSFGYT